MTKADETRKHIIKKAAPIFNMYGYDGFSLSLLTEAIGMTKGAVYGNFKNKDELSRAAFEYNLSIISNQISAMVSKRKHSCDKLIAYAGFYIDNFPTACDKGGCPVLNAAIDTDNKDLPVRTSVLAAIDMWLGSIIQIIKKGKKKGEIKPHADPAEFASLFVTSIEGGMMLSKVTSDPVHLERAANHLIDLVNKELRA